MSSLGTPCRTSTRGGIGRRGTGTPIARPTCDVSDSANLENLLHVARAEFGSVEILVNSAGWTKRQPTLEFAESDWNAILETNLTGTMRACRVFGRHMLERRYGRIINIGSLGSFVGLYEVAAYCASKGAVATLTRALASSGRNRAYV